MEQKECNTTVMVPLEKYKELEMAYELLTESNFIFREYEELSDFEKQYEDHRRVIGDYVFYVKDDFRNNYVDHRAKSVIEDAINQAFKYATDKEEKKSWLKSFFGIK